MPEIGATLREARMRARIDISEVETETKIRAKYLRALENEEWDLLPGPTFVKTFLRTYAEALGLDAKLLVDEYKLRHEHLSGEELSRPIGPARRRDGGRGRRGSGRRGVPREYLIGLIVVAITATLVVLGRSSSGDDADPTTPAAPTPTATTARAPTSTATTASTAAQRRRERARRAAARRVRLTLTTQGAVFVCLRASGDRTLVPGVTLTAGQRRGPFRATSYTLVASNTQVSLRADGRTHALPATAVRISKAGIKPLAAGARPTCGR